MCAFLPPDKTAHLIRVVRLFLGRNVATVKQVQEFQGLQNWACQVVRPGRAFLSRLSSLLSGAQEKGRKWVAITREAKLDLRWWDRFLLEFNGKSFFLETEWTEAHHMRLAVDACKFGAGGFWQHRWYAVRFDETHTSQCIREMIALFLACLAWGKFWAGKKIVFRSDNTSTGVVMAVNKRRVRSPHLMQWIRELHFLEAKYSFECRAVWIEGESNSLADHLSRGRVSEFKHEFRLTFGSEPRLLPTAVSIPNLSTDL